MALYRTTEYNVPDKFGFSVQEKHYKIYFQDDGCRGQPGF